MAAPASRRLAAAAEAAESALVPSPRSRPNSPWRLFARRFRTNGLAVVCLVYMLVLIGVAIAGPRLVPTDPNKIDYAAINALPSATHPLGTDSLGRDALARLVSGLRVSLSVAVYVEMLSLVVGVPLGLAAGFFGGKVDFAVTRVADVLFAFPGLLLAILVAAIFGSAVSERFGGSGRLALVAGALSLVSWPLMARLVRSQTLSVREREYVTAATAAGAGGGWIVTRHIVPQLVGLVITAITLDVSGVVVNEAVLSLLGLGIQPPDPSLGKMITDATQYLEANPLQVLLPSLALVSIVLAVSFIGDGLRDAFDPESTR